MSKPSDEAIAAFREKLMKALPPYTNTPEFYTVLTLMLKNSHAFGLRHKDIKKPGFVLQSTFAGNTYILDPQSQEQEDRFKSRFEEKDATGGSEDFNFLINHLVNLASQLREQETDYAKLTDLELLESMFYRRFAEAARELNGIAIEKFAQPITVCRGLSNSAFDEKQLQAGVFPTYHRGAGLTDYGIAQEGRLSLHDGSGQIGRGSIATSTSLHSQVGIQYALKPELDRRGHTTNVKQGGWLVIADVTSAVNVQGVNDRGYQELVVDDLTVIRAVCKVKQLQPDLCEIKIYWSPELSPAQRMLPDYLCLNIVEHQNNLTDLSDNPAVVKVKMKSAKDLATDIKHNELHMRLLQGLPLFPAINENVDQAASFTQHEKLLYQLLEQALLYVAKFPEQTLAHDRHHAANDFVELILTELQTLKPVNKKLETLLKKTQEYLRSEHPGTGNTIATEKFGTLSQACHDFSQQAQALLTSLAAKPTRQHSLATIQQQINGFDTLRKNLQTEAGKSVSSMRKFINWLSSLMSRSNQEQIKEGNRDGDNEGPRRPSRH